MILNIILIRYDVVWQLPCCKECRTGTVGCVRLGRRIMEGHRVATKKKGSDYKLGEPRMDNWFRAEIHVSLAVAATAAAAAALFGVGLLSPFLHGAKEQLLFCHGVDQIVQLLPVPSLAPAGLKRLNNLAG